MKMSSNRRRPRALTEVARSAGLSRDQVVAALLEALQRAVDAAWSSELERRFELSFNEELDRVEIHQILIAVDAVDPFRSGTQVSLAQLDASGMAGIADDEFLFQVFFRDEDLKMAIVQCKAYPSLTPPLLTLAHLAPGLTFPGAPAWLDELWPHRRLDWTGEPPKP